MFFSSHEQQAVKVDVVLSTTGATCVSVTTTAYLMESAAKTLNPNAPQVRVCSISFSISQH